jgi:hypothetical protein
MKVVSWAATNMCAEVGIFRRSLKQRIIIHSTMFGIVVLPDRACCVSGQLPEPHGVKTAFQVTT